mgnify:CR=1 FL=1
MGDIAETVSAAVAAVCAIGSLIGWFYSRKSRDSAERTADQAREAAERTAEALEELASKARADADRAERALQVAQEHSESASRSAEAVESIASAFLPDPLTVEWKSEKKFVLRNTSSDPITVEDFADHEAFLCVPFTVPVTLDPGESVPGLKTGALGRAFPDELVLIVEGEKDPVVVPL